MFFQNAMHFFFPKTSDPAEANKFYEASRTFCEQQTGWQITKRLIYAIRYRHNGHEYLAQVGDLDNTDGLVTCIFETSQAFLVCTPKRGVLRGEPMIVGRSDISDIEDFEP
jgi:hypothetical protein